MRRAGLGCDVRMAAGAGATCCEAVPASVPESLHSLPCCKLSEAAAFGPAHVAPLPAQPLHQNLYAPDAPPCRLARFQRHKVWSIIPWDPAALLVLYRKHQEVYQTLQVGGLAAHAAMHHMG